jgi:hypothetical protein
MASFWTKSLRLLLLWGWLLAVGPPSVLAATNSATGGIGGINNGTLAGGDGTGTAQITINVVDLALIKQARDLGGTVLPNGSNVSSGQVIYFVLYVDNVTGLSATDLRLQDLLDEAAFTYLANSLETTTVPTGSNDAAIWGGVWTPLTDAVGAPDDTASITDSGGPAGPDRVTLGTVTGQANQTLDIAGGSLRAIRFRVTVN